METIPWDVLLWFLDSWNLRSLWNLWVLDVFTTTSSSSSSPSPSSSSTSYRQPFLQHRSTFYAGQRKMASPGALPGWNRAPNGIDFKCLVFNHRSPKSPPVRSVPCLCCHETRFFFIEKPSQESPTVALHRCWDPWWWPVLYAWDVNRSVSRRFLFVSAHPNGPKSQSNPGEVNTTAWWKGMTRNDREFNWKYKETQKN